MHGFFVKSKFHLLVGWFWGNAWMLKYQQSNKSNCKGKAINIKQYVIRGFMHHLKYVTGSFKLYFYHVPVIQYLLVSTHPPIISEF